MFNALLRAKLSAFISGIFRVSKNAKNKSPLIKIGIGLLVLYMICYFIFMFGWFFYTICEPLSMANLQWFYFSVAGIMTIIFTFVFSVFSTQSLLFEAKDNEMLLAMPIPPKFILGSRLAIMIIMNLAFEALIFAPAGVIYIIKSQTVTAVGVLFFVIVFLLLPLLVMTLSCFFGWLVAIITARMRNKNTITVILSIGFLAVYFSVFSKLQNYINQLIQNGEAIANVIKKSVFPIYYLGTSIANQDFPGLIYFAICCIVPFVIVYILLSRSFIRIATTKKGAKKIKYTETPLNVSSVRAALTKRELRHFFGNAMYIMNGALGVLFTFVLAGVVAVNSDLLFKIFAQIPNFGEYIGPFLCVALGVLATTNIITAPSISLEGRNLWISQSSPIDAGDVLMAKVNMHLIVCMPSVILAAASCSIFLDISPVMKAFIFIIPSLLTVFSALFGLAVNLKFPKFDWINETAAIKQSISTMIAMFGSMGVVALPIIIYAAALKDFVSIEAFMLIAAVLFAAICAALYRYLMTRGKSIFESL